MWVVDDAKCIVVTRICVCVCDCVSVCLSATIRPHYCTDPDVTCGHGRGCPLVVHYWADLQSGHGLRCYGDITWTLVTSFCPSRDMMTARTAGWAGLRAPPAGDGGRPQNRAPHTGSWRDRAGDWPPTGGHLNITAAVWTAGFHWWRSGNKKRMQNVSEYMLVLALCLVWLLVGWQDGIQLLKTMAHILKWK